MRKNLPVIFITGCSRGLGKLLVETLALRDFVIYAGIKELADIKQLQTVWKKSHPTIHPIKLNIVLDKDCQRVVREIITNEGRVDILINNAAYGLVGPTNQFTPQEYLDILNTNAVGAFRLAREVIPVMRSQKKGRIINITSLNGLLSLPNFGLYSSSKFALEGLGLAMHYELKRSGIWVTNMAPGAIARKAEPAKKLPHLPAREKFWLVRKLMPMISQEEVVEAILKVINNPRPPARVVLGRDAKIITFLQRFLPQRLWDSLLSFVWER